MGACDEIGGGGTGRGDDGSVGIGRFGRDAACRWVCLVTCAKIAEVGVLDWLTGSLEAGYLRSVLQRRRLIPSSVISHRLPELLSASARSDRCRDV